MYYVYEWFIVDTNEVFYVGKGTRNRYKVRKHNKFFNDMIKRYICDSRIIKHFDNEKDAFAYEFDRVRELKAIGQCVCNIYDGGYGGTTEWWTDDDRQKYSEKNVMKSEQQRKRMSQHNPMKNKEIAQKTNSQKRRPVIIGDTEYPSVKAVCEKYKVTIATVQGWCWNGRTTFGESCRYKDNNQVSEYIHINNGQAKSITYLGKHYRSSTELARDIGVSQTTASRWCRQGRDSKGNPCRYDNDTRKIIDGSMQKSIPVIVNNVYYDSKETASKAIGISTYLLTQYLNGKRSDNKYICKYGNQQPSQGKSDNSTLEGSTTNG